MEFTLSRDKFSVILTTIIIAFAIGGLVTFYFGEFAIDKKAHFVLLLSSIFILLLCVFLYISRPLKYKIENKNIIICRLLGNKVISSDEIKSVRIPQNKELEWPIRTLGNGGIFGYTGRYYTKHIGSMIWFCSRRNNYIIIERKNKIPVVISPNEHKLFLQSWQG
jgi:Bacterial PH domain